MSSSASHALSEVEVFCAEKDSGFFPFGGAQGFGWWKRSYPEALRMTQNKRVPARVAPAPTSGYAKFSCQGGAKKTVDQKQLSFACP
jgi:hypothetical protein